MVNFLNIHGMFLNMPIRHSGRRFQFGTMAEMDLFMGVTIAQEHKSILIKAVSIAKANGFDIDDSFFTDVGVEDALFDGMKNYYNIIFDHAFARAFWTNELCMELLLDGDEDPQEVDLVATLASGNHPIAGIVLVRKSLKVPMWQFNLSQMVLSEDPLMYIKATLDEMDVA